MMGFSKKESDSLEEDSLDLEQENTQTRQRNIIITTVVVIIGALSYGAFKIITAPPVIEAQVEPDFEPIITRDFTDKDSLSALQAQQQIITKMQKDISQLTQERTDLSGQLQSALDKLDERFDQAFERAQQNWNNDMDAFQNKMKSQSPPLLPTAPKAQGVNGTMVQDPFGQLTAPDEDYRPAYPEHYDVPEVDETPLSKRQGIQVFSYRWPKSESQATYHRTSENYVPTGSFVTAVLIGAADANAGVNAQGDTAPILFRAIHNGILPNGKRSHLKDCFFTASVYGEISSNRGIARLQRMSCVFDKKGQEDIIDIPVHGTAFNFGRNGMRGTPVMRNGSIVKMAGLSGIFSGLGETAQAASSSTVTSPSGVVSSINPSKALMNLTGNALGRVGSKLSDYYIKLAEQYHPIIELNPGTIANLVFLEGFPLDPKKIEEYQARMSQSEGKTDVSSMASQLMQNYMNPIGVMAKKIPPSNPLMKTLPDSFQPSATQFEQTHPY